MLTIQQFVTFFCMPGVLHRIRVIFCYLLALQATAQTIPTTDQIIDPKIHTVLLYPLIGSTPDSPGKTLNPPVMLTSEDAMNGQQLQLEFDDLTGSYRMFRAKFIHCNADWQKSALNDIEFTYEYNDYPISEYQTSLNTKVLYYHYRFTVPRVKLPGNYILVVFDERNPRKILFTRRFMTYANKVNVMAGVRFSTSPQRQFQDQQIDMSIDYRNYQVVSPQDDFKVVIRQNYRDDKVITGLKPNNVRVFDQQIDYNLFDLSNTIPGGNEFRFFDTRTVLSRGNYIDRVQYQPDRTIAFISPDQPRLQGAYIQADDFNGLYVIDHRETGNPGVSADYIETVFTLNINELPDGEPYVNGAFNFWQLNDANRMTYDPAIRSYRASIWLKQGVYNYDYVVKRNSPRPTADELMIEGSYSGTENDYEVLVYHRPPATRADQLIAYKRISINKRK